MVGSAEGSQGETAGPARQRKIILIEVDAFYTSVKQQDHPELRGLPVAVDGLRGCDMVAAAGYEAQNYSTRLIQTRGHLPRNREHSFMALKMPTPTDHVPDWTHQGPTWPSDALKHASYPKRAKSRERRKVQLC
jgi:hypothetical protein